MAVRQGITRHVKRWREKSGAPDGSPACGECYNLRRMAAPGFALFETVIGRCAIAWGGRGIVGVQLPEAHEAATRARILRRLPDAREAPPPPAVRQAIDGLVALLGGEPRDLS